MLISITTTTTTSPEEVDMSATLVPDGATRDFESPWFGQPFRLHGVLRDGTEVAVVLSLTECAELYLLFDGDSTVRSWAEMMEARITQRGELREH